MPLASGLRETGFKLVAAGASKSRPKSLPRQPVARVVHHLTPKRRNVATARGFTAPRARTAELLLWPSKLRRWAAIQH